ncbi:MAG TPA: DNA mismatch repair endonuclease MutL [Nitrospira sp.]|nr:DNA mismatch repair endonuclease MutL [Nitrospira sp.]
MPAARCSPTIQVLPGEVVSRIAAGEVIERPAAVVKELIENSLDAGSRHIVIDVKDGGRSLIRVTDDGEGIRRADLLLAFERHATSKLRSDDDLATITTLGFRGEALPSIAAVSHVKVATARREDAVGAHASLAGGVPQGITDAPPVAGTRIEVAELFYNQPARKKFLKSVPTEFSHISLVVQQAALAWPSVHFRLTHNGHEILNYSAVTSDRERILQVYRTAFLDKTVEVRGRMAGCTLSGVLIDPVQARASKTPQDLFVNRRPVRNGAVFHAVMDGYGSLLAKAHHPTYVLFLDIDPERIDVNVHPAKREIRFADQEAVHRFIRQTVRHAFSGVERTLVLDMAPQQAAAASGTSAPLVEKEISGGMLSGRKEATADGLPSSQGIDASDPATLFISERSASYTPSQEVSILPLGQVLHTYLVAQVGRELHVIDQHTAHERVLFQRLWRMWMQRRVVIQPLLIPEPIELTSAETALLQKYGGELEQLGLLVDAFGPSGVLLRGVPVGLGPVDGASLVRDLLDDMAEWAVASSLEARAQPILATLACKSAVQAGRAMALPEIEQLVRDWVNEGLVTTCPHGRRTAFRLSPDELDKLFGRTGWA